MNKSRHVELSRKARQVRRAEKALFGLQNQRDAFTRGEHGMPAWALDETDTAITILEEMKDRLYAQLEGGLDGTVFEDWINDSKGLGFKSMTLVTGLLPHPTKADHRNDDGECRYDKWRRRDCDGFGMHSAASVHRYLGLHVVDGSAPSLTGGKTAGFDPNRRAFALYRVGGPIIRTGADNGSRYRAVFDEAKADKSKMHPDAASGGSKKSELLHPECPTCQEAVHKRDATGKKHWDCANLGGPHWSHGHRDNHARRVMVKAVFQDWWRVAHLKEPKYGGQGFHDDQRAFAPASASGSKSGEEAEVG